MATKNTCMKRAQYAGFMFLIILLGTVKSNAQCISGNCNTGSGVYVYPSGARYIGEFNNRERSGLGTCYYSDGGRYFGYWKDDRRHGEGIYTSSSGSDKMAEWRKGKLFELRATLSFRSPGKTKRPKTGCLYGDCNNGNGTMVYPDGAIYTGDFRDGKRNGFGECYFPRNAKFKGTWQNDLPHGNGTMVEADGSRQSGYWGRGRLLAAENSIPVKQSSGASTQDDPGCISGNCINGSGTYVYKDQVRYVGTFMNAKPHGQGIVYYPNGDRYTGRLEAGKLHGRGKLTSNNGREIQGHWEDGIFVQSVGTDPMNPHYKRRDVKIWAVVIGIASYPNMPKLYYTDDDAYQFYAFLKSPEGGAVPDDQVELLIDEKATRENIVAAMKKVFSKAGPKDIAILYFSGHGKPGAFLPVDNLGEQNKIYHQEITSILDNSNAKVKLCIADACHSGGLFVARGDTPPIQNYYTELAQTNPGSALILSSKQDEISLESKSVRQGVFSHYMIRGLKGEADGNADKVVTISELFDFVYHRVRAYTDNQQSPTIKGTFDRNMPVSIIRD